MNWLWVILLPGVMLGGCIGGHPHGGGLSVNVVNGSNAPIDVLAIVEFEGRELVNRTVHVPAALVGPGFTSTPIATYTTYGSYRVSGEWQGKVTNTTWDLQSGNDPAEAKLFVASDGGFTAEIAEP